MGVSIGGLRTWLTGLPTRMARGVPWAHVEPAGLGVGTATSGEFEEREARERQAREAWRSPDPEGDRPVERR